MWNIVSFFNVVFLFLITIRTQVKLLHHFMTCYSPRQSGRTLCSLLQEIQNQESDDQQAGSTLESSQTKEVAVTNQSAKLYSFRFLTNPEEAVQMRGDIYEFTYTFCMKQEFLIYLLKENGVPF